MPCDDIKLPDGTTVIACARGRRPIVCRSCGRRGDLLCDGKLTKGKRKTCDAPLCRSCAVSNGGKDFCPSCAKGQPEQLSLDVTKVPR